MDPFDAAFPALDASQRNRLRAQSTERRYATDDVIIKEGSAFSALFVVVDGIVGVEKEHLGGGIPLAELGPGAVIGEVSYIDGSPASASVVARTDVTARAIEDVDGVVSSDPELAAGLYRSLAILLARRLRYGNEERVLSALQWG
jgi:extracellular factor (EF) 3-hydroxypalmitic acid methyl ester biosynthesis protein